MATEPLDAFRALGATEDELSWLTQVLGQRVIAALESGARTDAMTAARMSEMLAGVNPDTLPDGPLDPRTGKPLGADWEES